jgi:hypothetical protein
MFWIFDPSAILSTLARAKLSGTVREFSGILLGCTIIAASNRVAPPQEWIIAAIGAILSIIAIGSYSYGLIKGHG